MKPTMLKACTFFVLASGVAPALGQDVEFGVTDMERKQTFLEGKLEKRLTPPKDPVWEVKKIGVYDAEEGRFKSVPVTESVPKTVKVGATLFEDELKAKASAVEISSGDSSLSLAGVEGTAKYGAVVEEGQLNMIGEVGGEVYLMTIELKGDAQLGDEATHLGSEMMSDTLVGADAKATGSVDAGLTGVGLGVGGEAFAGAKISGGMSLKAMICKLGAAAGLSGEASAGAGVSAGAGMRLDWEKMELTVDAELAATLGLGVGASAEVVVSLEGLVDPDELSRCLVEKAKAAHAAGVEGTRIVIQPAFDLYYLDEESFARTARMEERLKKLERAELVEKLAARAERKSEALQLVEPLGLADFPILYWDGRTIPVDVYREVVKQAVVKREETLLRAGYYPWRLGIKDSDYGVDSTYGVNVRLGDSTRANPGYNPFEGYMKRPGDDVLNLSKKVRLRNHYPH